MTASSASRPLPGKVLLFSASALLLPVLESFGNPDWIKADVGMLMWLTALLPAFLLTFHKGWRGVSIALAGGMAVLSLTQVMLLLTKGAEPNWGLLLGVVIVFIGVTLGLGYFAELLDRERRKAEAQALTDALSGLPNRRHMEVHLDAAFASARRGANLSLVLFDLDHFKGFNDTHGHAAGDQIIRAFGGILQGITRRMDLSARFGGEEFISILSDTDPQEAVGFGERILEALRKTSFQWGLVTASAGVASFEPGMGTPDLLVVAADQALYKAKEYGRDRVFLFTPFADEEPGAMSGASVERELVSAPASSAGSEEPARSRQRRVGPASIVVVDDDEDVANTVGKMLVKLGHTSIVFTDSQEALAALEDPALPVDLLMVDVIMPNLNGLALVERLSPLRADIPVLYMSGYIQGEVTWKGLPGGKSGFIEKPMGPQELREKIGPFLTPEQVGAAVS